MNTKWISKVATGTFAIALMLGSTTLASAKEKPVAGNSEKHQNENQNDSQKGNQEKDKQEKDKRGKDNQGKDKQEKGKGKQSKEKHSKGESSKKKAAKAKKMVKSKIGKSIEKRINSSETSINKITKSINSFFGVSGDTDTEKVLSKNSASNKYRSYSGKLKSEINKLKAIDKLLANYKKKKNISTQEIDTLQAKIKELQQLAADEIKRLKSLTDQAASNKTGDASGSDKGTTTVDPTQPSNPDVPTAPTDPASPTDPSGESAQ
ncbi:hypothetical protein [Bacillus sp. FJAT-49736]|uniref:hypothetical protein n=1 Tax=Bacillus sp. FJAT-49736 TaxID=2833582 RepID=UPI001BC8EC92|nr:hypothetical protein [Bacillus sp. FJAT-49736]MBS4174728.1 hypothetical protein [Bacillus sp. FJAT-49736]